MNRPVKISFALNGFVAEVGCQTLVFNDLTQLLGDLKSYLQDPEAAETHFRKNALNTKVTLGCPPMPAPAGCYQTQPPLDAYCAENDYRAQGTQAGSTLCQRG